MGLNKLPRWLQHAVASLGGAGIFVVAFLDSSVLSFPVINDLLVMGLSAQKPARMPYYALMATLGSLAGSILLYFLAKKGGEVMFRKRAGTGAERIRQWVRRNGFLSVAVASVLPPPFPFKAFIVAAGVFQVPVKAFVFALVAGRGLRYFAEGFLAVRYGADAARYLLENKLQFSLVVAGGLLLGYLLRRYLLRPAQPRS